MDERLKALGINAPTNEQKAFGALNLNGANNALIDGAMGARLKALGVTVPHAEHITYAAANLNDADAALLDGAATARLTTLNGGVPSAQQVQAGVAYMVGGHSDPDIGQVNYWDANPADRTACVLVGAAGLDPIDADMIAAAKECVASHIPNPSDDQIKAADHIINGGGLGQANASEDQINGAVLLMTPQYGAGAIAAPALPLIDAVATVPAGEATMRIEAAWGIQHGFGTKVVGQIPVVAKVVAVAGGYHEFEFIGTKPGSANRNATARLLDNTGNVVGAGGTRFRVPDGDIALGRHAVDDVVVFDKLTAHVTPGYVTMNDVDQH